MSYRKYITPNTITVLYLILGGLWIIYSDKWVADLTSDFDQLNVMQTYKGWFYISITALLLHLLMWKHHQYVVDTSEMLKATERKFEKIFWQHPNPMILVDKVDCKIVRGNKIFYDVFGIPAAKLNDFYLRDLFKTEVLDKILSNLRKSRRDNNIGIFEAHKVNKSILKVDVTAFELQFENESFWLITVDDVTAELQNREQVLELTKNLEKKVRERTYELRNANDELEAFTYSVSHDLRAPLRAIDGFSQTVIEDYGNSLEGPALGYLERVRKASQKMAVLIDDLLRLSRISRTNVQLKKVDLSVIAQQIADQEKAAYSEKNYRVNIQGGLTALTDDGLVRILIQNLLSNAFKYSSKVEEPIIEFGVTSKRGKNYYFVRDSGIGFESQQVEKILQPFQRLHMDNEYHGVGIGLATVDRIIKKLKGDLIVESNPGSGSTFYFYLGENS
jgi:PAS domain S-box-containing protein